MHHAELDSLEEEEKKRKSLSVVLVFLLRIVRESVRDVDRQ
jgi:hypothetical protein